MVHFGGGETVVPNNKLGGSTIELGPNTIRLLGREIARRPVVLDGAQVSRSVDSRLVPA
jgi:hypothetical protein